MVTNDVAIPADPGKPGRLVSLDALRGLNMFWIVGIDELIPRLSQYAWGRSDTPWGRGLRLAATQLDHVEWEGLHFEDLIFPLFVFIVGVSVAFSVAKTVAERGRPAAVVRVVYRTAVLYLLGVMLYGGFDQPLRAFAGMTGGHHAIRWMGVLQRIAIAYGIAGLLFCSLRPRWLAVAVIVILVGYWAALTYVQVPGVGTHSYAAGRNLTNYVDQRFLGGWKWDGLDYDPEGLLSNIPAAATCLLGVFAGMLLKSDWGSTAKVATLVLGGAALAAAGYAWGVVPSPVQFPVVKKLWTSSYVLLAGGYSAAVLGLFYLVVDVWGLRRWCVPFVWIGTNAITIYMLVSLGFVSTFAHRLVGGGHHDNFGAAQAAITTTVELLLTFAVARFLYVRGVFVRV